MKVANSLGTAFIVQHRLDDGSRPDDQILASNAADASKKLKLDLSGITPSTTRTVKPQDRDGTNALLDDVQKDLPVYAAATNSGNAYSVTLAPAPTGLVAGMRVKFKVAAANTGAATLNVNALGAIAIKKSGATTLGSGDMATGQIIEVCFDGTNFQLMSGSPATVSTLNRVTITATGAWSWTPTFTGFADFTLQGAGGGGAGGGGTDLTSNPCAGAGAGAGALLKIRLAVTAGVAVTGSVGAKGTAGAIATDGTDGGDTTCGTYTASGGKKGLSTGVAGAGGAVLTYAGKTGGIAGPGTVAATPGTASTCSQSPGQGVLAAEPGAGGGGGGDTTGATGTLRAGASGGGAEAVAGGSAGSSTGTGAVASGGGGGSSSFGTGGGGGACNATTGTNPTSPAGTSYGAGGAGGAKSGTANQAGTAGMDGVVLIEWVG
jgi:hypothetical protein